ncbi:sugar ABC transporter permease [Deinococcus indicus]|jgi:trehalose/maltose transport system permease protein|uniref:Sugar ABC transporter permease n=1 Tax=Deinococcus indicus TaxID=223556 RepID=A0A246BQP7_9DEIO|nr:MULTISPECIES: sugar ABC transporter permease [Deinococcus]MBX8466647.1 sugar ABC transporter permease [Deinococcus sp. RIT780]MCD0158457.1 sugar ABC transporter permease [Deinococcus sp. 6GRE01]MCD0162046.1 sugar ABC transporter permease [Deinococcus sp. 6YEL10]MCD0166151.1 sugar ABC transporter permease [Deinococcus sp. 12RED42]MCD0169195.1 sugar ABC transporter permease [Deinococcus sp. 23YEL01]
MTVKTPVSAAPVKTRGIEAARARTAIWLLLPTLIAIALVAGYPLYRTIYFSLFEANLTSPDQRTFIGLGNFWFTTPEGIGLGFLQDPKWWGAVKNTLLFTVVSVFLETVFGMIIALVVNSAFKGRGFLRTAMLVPWAIPTVVSAQMWAYLYNDSFGLIGRGLLGGQAVLANTDSAIWALIAVDVWKTTSFMALLILAGLQSLPSDMYEAADMDGASKWTQFWRLTLPLLRPALLVALVFRSLDALRVFDVMSVMLGNVNAASTSMTGYARQALIDNQLLGLGSAVSVAVFVIIMVIVVMYVTAFRVKFD